MDTDELIVRARQNCCRLCLAPDSECVPIFDSYAADREPISMKIQSCVKIKVSQADRLSSKICHLCLSFLNSWQSFKNRCIASQIKQQSWLEMAGKNGSGKANKKISIMQNKSVSNNSNNNKMPMESSVKEELREEHENSLELDNNEGETIKVNLDPTEFLIQQVDEDDDNVNNSSMMLDNQDQTSSCNDGPPILTSLGLTHIAAVNPYSFLNTETTEQDGNQIDSVIDNDKDENRDNFNQSSNNEQQTLENLSIKIPKTLSSCSICKLAFSTRANARRHERNIHGKFINSSLFGGRKSIIKKSQVTPEMMGIYDYTKPEKYRHLLTEQKILFIRKNELFLKQYQTLTCNCCTKTHPTYKNFMAHMRKKYPTLARNLCFKCLKQFPTKVMFVSHLKKKCCINLYKLYLVDDSIPKDGIVQVSPEKMGAKDLLTNKVYVCKICSKKCRLKVEFRLHVNEKHSDTQKKDVPAGHCGYCGLNIEDPVERKRHYNNMECIVSLKCVTCEEEFDNHQSFIDHVYEAHLPHQQIIDNVLTNEDEIGDDDDDDEMKNHLQRSLLSNNKPEQLNKELTALKTEAHYHIDSRSPQNCKICGAHYNNYNNVLRHMEAKHPDQLPETYKCINCNVGFARMSMLREHMLEKHGKKVPKYTRRDTSAVLQIFACKICTENFPSIDKWITHQSNVHSHFICCQCNFQNKNIDEFKKHIEAHPSLMQSKISGSTNNINLNNSNTNKSNITQSTNETNESSRFDYIMKDVLEIRKGIRLQDEQNSDGNKTPSPPQKKIKLDTDLRECRVCHALFHTNLGLSNHMRTHNAQQRLNHTIATAKVTKAPKIPKSSQSGESEDTKKMHFGLTASDLLRRIRCRLCQKRFSTKKGYRKHMLNDHQINNVLFIKCTICNSDFTHEKGLKLHMLRTHDMVVEDVSSINLKYECGECQSIFENSEQLNVHRNVAHNQMDDDEQSMNGGAESSVASVQSIQNNAELSNVWFQCRYCPANFDTNKKLAIHTNSHQEFDSNDYSCKDCGNVYSGRKSLWVHRYKKHPLLPEPSLCTICNKTFFDKNMLDLHMKNYHMNGVDSSNIKTENLHNLEENEDEDDENDEYDVNKSSINEIQDGNDSLLEDHEQLPGVRCTMCSLRFTDVETFTKHMSMHDMDFYTDNPLAAMFDTGPEDPNKFYERRRLAENGEYMCDICSKTFPMLTAFKVHRNWHFRSDGKQIPADPNTTWRGTQRKKKDPATSVKCQYCNSLFISNNNLRRHILELHKREISNGEAPKVFIEKYLECKRCEMKFRFKEEWISHKLDHVKNETIDKTLGWGCEICGKLISRKERLIQHVKAHLKEDDQSQRNSNGNNGNSSSSSSSSRNHDRIKNENRFENNSQDSNSIGSMSDKMNDEDEKEEDDSNDRQEEEIIAHVTSDGPIMRKCDNQDEDNDDDNDFDRYDYEDDDRERGEEDNDNDNVNDNDNGNDDDNGNDNDNVKDNDSDRYDYEDDDRERGEEEVVNSSTEDEDGDNDNDGDGDNENDNDGEGDEDDEDEDEERRSNSEDSSNDSDDNDAVSSSSSIKQRQLYSCDLCHVHFETSKELQSHVTSHFLNGPGSVILTETEKKSEDEDTINDDNDDDDDDDDDDRSL